MTQRQQWTHCCIRRCKTSNMGGTVDPCFCSARTETRGAAFFASRTPSCELSERAGGCPSAFVYLLVSSRAASVARHWRDPSQKPTKQQHPDLDFPPFFWRNSQWGGNLCTQNPLKARVFRPIRGQTSSGPDDIAPISWVRYNHLRSHSCWGPSDQLFNQNQSKLPDRATGRLAAAIFRQGRRINTAQGTFRGAAFQSLCFIKLKPKRNILSIAGQSPSTPVKLGCLRPRCVLPHMTCVCTSRGVWMGSKLQRLMVNQPNQSHTLTHRTQSPPRLPASLPSNVVVTQLLAPQSQPLSLIMWANSMMNLPSLYFWLLSKACSWREWERKGDVASHSKGTITSDHNETVRNF